MKKYEVFLYDVWGNDELGYYVNETYALGKCIYVARN